MFVNLLRSGTFQESFSGSLVNPTLAVFYNKVKTRTIIKVPRTDLVCIPEQSYKFMAQYRLHQGQTKDKGYTIWKLNTATKSNAFDIRRKHGYNQLPVN